MLVSVFSDASFCPNTRAAGYGFYCKSERSNCRGGGPFKSKLRDSSRAEIRGIINAVYCGFKSGVAEKGDKLLIQSDCLYAMDCIQKHVLEIRPHVANPDPSCEEQIFWDVLAHFNAAVEFRHVKAHTGKPNSRYWVNRYCDKEAKKWMRRKRAEVLMNE